MDQRRRRRGRRALAKQAGVVAQEPSGAGEGGSWAVSSQHWLAVRLARAPVHVDAGCSLAAASSSTSCACVPVWLAICASDRPRMAQIAGIRVRAVEPHRGGVVWRRLEGKGQGDRRGASTAVTPRSLTDCRAQEAQDGPREERLSDHQPARDQDSDGAIRSRAHRPLQGDRRRRHSDAVRESDSRLA